MKAMGWQYRLDPFDEYDLGVSALLLMNELGNQGWEFVAQYHWPLQLLFRKRIEVDIEVEVKAAKSDLFAPAESEEDAIGVMPNRYGP